MIRAGRIRMALALAALAGCSDAPQVRPVLDLPPDTSDAYPFGDLEELTLAAATPGAAAEEDLALRTVAFGDDLSIADLPFATDVVLHLTGRSGSGDVAYGRTCAFQVEADTGIEAPPHLWFSRLVKWGTGPVPAVPARTGGLAWALAEGGAAFAGGAIGAGPDAARVSSVETFDPTATGAFAPLGVVLTERAGARVAALPDGRAVLCGGVVDDGAGGFDAAPAVELIDPRPDVVNRLQVIEEGPRLRGHAMAALVDGRIVVVGGETQGAAGEPFALTGEAWTFRIGEGDVLEAGTRLLGELITPRTEHTLTRLSDEPGADILIVGGRDAAGQPVAPVEVFRPLSDEFAEVAPAMLVPRWGHVAVRLPGGFVLVLGGWMPDGLGGAAPVTDMELYDPILGQFTSAGRLSATAGLNELTATPLPDGRVLLAGGRNATGTAVSTVLIAQLDPLNGRVNIVSSDSLAVARAGHSAVPLCDGTILLVGGASGAIDAPAERYSPPKAGRR